MDLLPNLLSVGHNNFPGMIEAVYIVNAGWSHRSMWTIIKRILPRSALDKINFFETPDQVEGVIDLARLPKGMLSSTYGAELCSLVLNSLRRNCCSYFRP